jgi:crotonobetainyl-CoA:carnitine CoA-transferase CaiB-like acyl-CoA transferase
MGGMVLNRRAEVDRFAHGVDAIARGAIARGSARYDARAMTARPAPGPLAGLLVADCSTVLAGPYATMLLADLGADVVKMEPPEGDATRGWGPPWVGEGEQRTAAYYLAVNRNKRSLRLDLKTEAGRDILRRLLRRADVLVENQRVGGFARLGFDDAALEALNPRLVHLAISGYGPTGPAAATPGYDFVIQAVSGLMSITGQADADGGEPAKVGVAISDLTTGMLGATAVLAAIAGRDRPGSPTYGRGQRIDISLLESTLSWLANQAQNLFVTGEAPGRLGNAHPNIVPYETFATADGEIAVAVGSERQWPRFVSAIGAPELTDDPRFATNGDRVANRDALRPLLAERLAAAPTTAWLARLAEADVPAGPINDLAAAFASPQVAARGLLVDVEHPVLGSLRQVGPPFELHRTPATVRTAPPLLGEQSDEILAELGFAAAEVAALRRDGVV